MTEPVRLVIWDLDDTYWTGTLSEGPVTYSDAHHEIVLALARRGIISSICSKNDRAPVEALLREHGAWDYFVFPSINWEAKGPRVAALVDSVQLRPESILFVDDNAMNRSEVQHYVPGIQVADETTILAMLDHPLFTGKDDAKLTRLEQYRLLQRRKADEARVSAASGDNHEFLRASDVQLTIDYDVLPHLDRAIELVNRTNQLNFTKNRLPEDQDAARAAMRDLIGRHNILCGMVRVHDRYGDYGWCGFFAIKRTHRHSYVVQFAFSCRILNMGVEQWLYRHLGSPDLKVTEPVSSRLPGDQTPDWITIGCGGAEPQATLQLGFVGLRGSCDLRPLEHYLGSVADALTSELMIVRRGMQVRFDHSLLLVHALNGVDKSFVEDCRGLNYTPQDFETKIFPQSDRSRTFVLSMKGDVKCALYRHKRTGMLIPVRLMKGGPRDYLLEDPTLLMCPEQYRDGLLAHLAEHFTYVGRMPQELLRESLLTIFEQISPKDIVLLVLPDEATPRGRVHVGRVEYNKVVRGIAQNYPQIHPIMLSELVEKSSEMKNVDHYDRMVYFRLFQHALALAADPPTDAKPAPRQEAA